MRLFDCICRWFDKSPAPKPKTYTPRFTIFDLTRRLGLTEFQLKTMDVSYKTFKLPKRSGGHRLIAAPSAELKRVQRRVLRRILSGLRAHPHATGFEKGHSIVTNAAFHRDSDVLLKLDIREFFATTRADRLSDYFQSIGWDRDCSEWLVKLCSWNDCLPQGAPTSPRLSNLLSFHLDTRLSRVAELVGARYSRYADDLTFSFNKADLRWFTGCVYQNPKTLERISPERGIVGEHQVLAYLIRMSKTVLADYGYALHQNRKLQVRRRHECQLVTGLVVNERVNLPRHKRRWLRAVEHRLATGREATLTPAQFEGWRACQQMVLSQREGTSLS